MFGKPTPAGRVVPRLESLEGRDVPTVFGVNDAYNVRVGQSLTVNVADGVLANDYSDINFGDTLVVSQLTPIRYVGTNEPFPGGQGVVLNEAGHIVAQINNTNFELSANGSFRLNVPNNIPNGVTQATFTYIARNLDTPEPNNPTGIGSVTFYFIKEAVKYTAVAADANGDGTVKVFDSGSGVLRYTLNPFPGFTGGARVAVGDVNTDGVDDLAVTAGVGGGARVIVYDGRDLGVLLDTVAFDVNFRGGAYVAIGDYDGDGAKDVIVGAGEQGGPRVQVYGLNVGGFGPQLTADFFAYDPSFRNGVRVAAGDTDGNGRDEIITTPGAGGGPHVKVFDSQTTGVSASATPAAKLSFFSGDAGNRDGLFIAAGDLRGDGRFDIITGAGGGSAVVRVFDGRTGGQLRDIAVSTDETTAGTQATGASGVSQAGGPASGTLVGGTVVPVSLLGSGTNLLTALPASTAAGGARVASGDWNGDGIDDIIVGGGPGQVGRLRVYSSTSSEQIASVLAYDTTFLGGINVGSN